MTRGSTVYSALAAKASQAQQEVDQAERKSASIARDLHHAQKNLDLMHRIMAEERLSALQSDPGLARTYEDQVALGKLSECKSKLKSLKSDLLGVQSKMAEAKDFVESKRKSLHQARIEHRDAERRTGDALMDDAEFTRLQTAIQSAEEEVQNSDNRIQLAREDRDSKQKKYLADPLFSYLHERHYGTQEYVAGRLVRHLDAWVASIIHYSENKANYDVLGNVVTHLASRKAQAEKGLRKLREENRILINAAEIACGQTVAEEALKQADDALSDAELKLSKLRNQESFLRQEVENHSGSNNEFAKSALRILARSADEAGYREIGERFALSSELAKIRNDQRGLVKSLKDSHAAAQNDVTKTKEMHERAGRAVSMFRSKGYHQSSSRFRSSWRDDFVDGYIAGTISQSMLNQAMASSHYKEEPYRPSSSSSSSWGSSNGSFGGGFSSGGGDMGGGFSTGGGD